MTKRAGLARAALVLWGVLLCAPAQADAIFVVFESPAAGALPVKGAALDDEMAKLGALEVDSLDFGIANSLVIDPRRALPARAAPSFLPLRMVLPLGPGVPALLQTAGAGGHYGDVTVHFRTGGRQPVDYATLALKLVAVTGVEVSAGAGAPQARVALTYGSMKLDVFPRTPRARSPRPPRPASGTR